MNNLIAASRELVFNSRQVQEDMASNNPDFQPLAEQYVDEARQGAGLVSSEYKALLQLSVTEAQSLAAGDIKSSQSQCVLPWVETQNCTLVSMDVGCLEDGESNVVAPTGNEQLYVFDKQARYFDPQSNLVYGNRNLKLPAPDNDLTFCISALPPAVDGTISPARLIPADDFVKLTPVIANEMPTKSIPEYIPCAAQARLSVDLKSSLGWANQTVCVTTGAVANGGSSLPQVFMDAPNQ
jgi:hypothetical protein